MNIFLEYSSIQAGIIYILHKPHALMRHPGAKTVVEGACDYHSKTSLDYKTLAWLKLCSFTLIFLSTHQKQPLQSMGNQQSFNEQRRKILRSWTITKRVGLQKHRLAMTDSQSK